MPGGRPFVVIHRQAGVCVGRFPTYAAALKALPRLARHLLKASCIEVAITDDRKVQLA